MAEAKNQAPCKNHFFTDSVLDLSVGYNRAIATKSIVQKVKANTVAQRIPKIFKLPSTSIKEYSVTVKLKISKETNAKTSKKPNAQVGKTKFHNIVKNFFIDPPEI